MTASGSYESPAEHTEGVAGTTYETHQANAYPHGEFASFTCPVCVKRCVDAGQAEVGRPYIVEHADEWAARDGIR